MHSRHALMGHVREHDVLEQVDVEVEDVELRGPSADLAQHDEMARGMVADAGEAQPLRDAGDELGRRPRIAAGEQRHLVAEADEFFREPGDDPLGAAIEPRRYGFAQGSDLGDAHDWFLSGTPRGSEGDIVSRRRTRKGRSKRH